MDGTGQERFFQLSKRLSHVRKGITTEKQLHYSAISKKLDATEKAIKNYTIKMDENLASFRDQIEIITKGLDSEAAEREKLSDEKSKSIEALSVSLRDILTKETEERRKGKNKLTNQLESEISSLSRDLSEIVSERCVSREEQKAIFSSDIQKLQELIEAERTDRLETEKAASITIDSTLETVARMIDEQKRAHDSAEERFISTLEEISTRCRIRLATEKKEREEGEDMLLRLLEDTCKTERMYFKGV
ncbi:Giardin subunit beta-like protein [Aduncisulcus paluster]|uniref:Giardin subunit beta-like protein n=1 Tax=Aduncisulcus paluster TaxID=2918883 RepID=A0ABQ5KV72_9EUKA|nr:Giardin subunit beta-like protein [Aduncisulcus paluster]